MNNLQGELNHVRSHIKNKGERIYDHQLKRYVIDLVGLNHAIYSNVILELCQNKLDPKFDLEMSMFLNALNSYIKEEYKLKHYRRLFHDNAIEFPYVFQCISSIQFLPFQKYWVMLVTQRSGDCKKMKDDWTFYAHAAMHFEERVGPTINFIQIKYGSVHFETL